MFNYGVKSSKDEPLFALEVRRHHRLGEYGADNQTPWFAHQARLRAAGCFVCPVQLATSVCAPDRNITALRGRSWIPINPNLVFFSLTQYVVGGLSVLLYLISGLCQLQRLKLLAWTRNFFFLGCFSNYKLDKIYRCQGQKSQQLGSTSSFTIICGQSSLYGKGLPLPKMWLSLSPKYQYTEQINFWIKEMFLAVIYI